MPRKRTRGPKIYVNTDLEGISGVWTFAQTRDRSSPRYVQACESMMGDIAALVRGLRDGGASDILVLDSHGGGDNFIAHLMEPGARYITGSPRPGFAGMDKTYGGVVLLGQHAMKGTRDGVLNHTQSSAAETRYWYNGRESGEIAQQALYAGGIGVPVIMVTGDRAACREARRFLGREIVTVAVKRGLSREAAELLPLEEARKLIYEGAKKAVAAVPACKPYRIRMPIKCRREFIRRSETPSETRVEVREATIRDLSRICSF